MTEQGRCRDAIAQARATPGHVEPRQRYQGKTRVGSAEMTRGRDRVAPQESQREGLILFRVKSALRTDSTGPWLAVASNCQQAASTRMSLYQDALGAYRQLFSHLISRTLLDTYELSTAVVLWKVLNRM